MQPPEPGLAPTARPADAISLRRATWAWFLISLQTFGGPAGQIAVMHRKLVDEERWIGERRFTHALNYCMLLPGPEAQQLAIYTGWLLNGTLGGLIAGSLFVLPGLLALLALSSVYVAFGTTAVVTSLFTGVAPAVIAIVVQAVHRLARRALTDPVLAATAVASFLTLTLTATPFPVVILLAGVVGLVASRHWPGSGGAPPVVSDAAPPLISDETLAHPAPSWRRSGAVLAVGLALWAAPVVAVAVVASSTPVLLDQALFFSGTAVITFGGAYAVLSFVAQQAVHAYGWLTAGEMVRGLSLAETTPGPLIMVVTFVAFVGAYRHPGALDPWLAALLAALLVCWVTFVPSFLFVLLGAPYMEKLRGSRGLSAALTGVTAAVVGVIANLAMFFALHTLFTDQHTVAAGPLHVDLPRLGSADPTAFAITAIALALMFLRSWSPLRTLGLCAALGVGLALIGAGG